MGLTEDAVLEELKKVIDPELFVNIVDLGLIYKVVFEDAAAAAEASKSEAEQESGDKAAEESPAVAETESSPSESAPPSTAALAETIEWKPDEPESAPATEGETETPAGDGQLVKIDMTLTSPMCPAGPQLIGQSKAVVGQLSGVADVEVKIVLDPPWSPDRMTDDARDQLGIF